MLFSKFLPREGNFFEMFNQHAERIVEAARAFENLVTNYNDVHLREQYNRDVDNAERAADRVMRSAMSKLFREEPDVREVIKLKAIYELLETITDKCEDVANVIEGIVLENS